MELSVLIVDDEPLLVEEAACGLELAGFAVLTAGSAAEARSVLAAHDDIGVLLTDIRMPKEDGLSLARAVQADRDACHALGIILMTGHGMAAPEAGIAACVPKPFAIGDMIDLVGRTLTEITEVRRGGMTVVTGMS
jgi:DNA-binding NtrC family response regulator